MNIPVFHVSTTNIFPAANSNAGGQLSTEFNMRSRETVSVGPSNSDRSIDYFVGPSYVHSEDSFMIESNGSSIRMYPGRALVSGHFVDCKVPIDIDLIELNHSLQSEGETQLAGALSIGLRALYNTESTMMASILVEESSGLFSGIQVVILPSDQFITPLESPKDPSSVTAHIKLADFNYANGAITNVVNNYPKKCIVLSSDRVESNVDYLESGFVTKSGLNPNYLYIMAGKSRGGQVENDSTWCDARDSLMVWDNSVTGVNPESITTIPSTFKIRDEVKEADFLRASKYGNQIVLDSKGPVSLVVPHKQVDGMHTDTGDDQYYPHKFYTIPSANFATGESGVVTQKYTNYIKEIEQKINAYYGMPHGKQMMYIEELNDRNELPSIRESWSPGDYVLVGRDNTVYQYDSDTEMFESPTTLYVVLPGLVSEITSNPSVDNDACCISKLYLSDMPGLSIASSDPYELEDNSIYRGRLFKDFFTIIDDSVEVNYNTYYYEVSSCVPASKKYADPILLTSNIRLATTDLIGGFLNVDETSDYQDGGYVFRDDNGHLRLLDYSLLRSDGLSYQLGQDITIGSGLTVSAIQEQLNDFVNERIAFANSYHALQALQSSPGDSDRTWIDMIKLTVVLPDTSDVSESEDRQIIINGIDSRFGTSVLLKIEGNASSNFVVNISNCSRLRIDSNIGGSPVININNCCLYYDASILNRVNSIDNLSLWYDGKYDTVYDSVGIIQSTPPNIFVDGNTVISLDPIMDSNHIDFWSLDSAVNDNHYSYGLRSITFDRRGNIISASIFIRCTTTANVDTGYFVAKQDFTLPQSGALNYPSSRLTKPIKITGDFVHSYSTQALDGSSIFVVIDNNFTAVSGYFNSDSQSVVDNGAIYIYQDIKNVNNILGIDPNDGAMLGSSGWHIFSGGVVG